MPNTSGITGHAVEGGPQAANAIGDLLADVDPTDQQALLTRPSEEIGKYSSDRQNRDKPVEPIARCGCCRAGGTLTAISNCSAGGAGSACRFASCGCCRPCCTAKRVKQTSPAQQIAEACGHCGGNIVLLACEETADAARIEGSCALMLGNGAHDNRGQHSEQRTGPVLAQSSKLTNRLRKRILIPAAQ